jgi:hypothetical protein
MRVLPQYEADDGPLTTAQVRQIKKRVPPAAPHGQTPKLGVLYPSLVQAIQAAFEAARL